MRFRTKTIIIKRGMFRLDICTDNSAFKYTDELPKILHTIAKQITDGQYEGYCYDTNGNKVGSWLNNQENL